MKNQQFEVMLKSNQSKRNLNLRHISPAQINYSDNKKNIKLASSKISNNQKQLEANKMKNIRIDQIFNKQVNQIPQKCDTERLKQVSNLEAVEHVSLHTNKNTENIYVKSTPASKLVSNAMLPKLDLNMLTEEVENKQHLERNDTTKKYSNDIKVNDTLEEEIDEEIFCSPHLKECEFIDPFSGEKMQIRKKFQNTIEKQLESSGSIFTGRDEISVIKLKRKRDAEMYSKILREQIEEKAKITINNNRIQTMLRESNLSVKSKLKENKIEYQDQSPAITSSRHSNSNTACTRDLFTPSEDNCLSQHLNGYSSRKMSNSNLSSIQSNRDLTPVDNSNNLYFNTFQENKLKNEIDSIDKQLMIQSVNENPFGLPKLNEENIYSQDPNESSIILLEDAVESLLKEQQKLK